jgi:hypothetical protein
MIGWFSRDRRKRKRPLCRTTASYLRLLNSKTTTFREIRHPEDLSLFGNAIA